MVVDDFDFMRGAILPDETDSPLTVDADAVLACSVTSEGFQAIARRNTEGVELGRCVQHQQLPPGRTLDVRREPTRPASSEQPLGLGVSEGANHGRMIALLTNSGNHNDVRSPDRQ